MSTTRACLACRARKVKCVPSPTQRCERCTALAIEICVYEPTKKRGVGKTLRMGEACKRCRARKRKCDANRPCATCVDANRAAECEREIIVAQPRLSGQPQPALWDESGPSNSTDTPARERRTIEEVVPDLPTKAPVAVTTQLGPEVAPPSRALILSLGHNGPSPHTPPNSQPHMPGEDGTRNRPQIAPPPFSVLSSLLFPGIPPAPHLPLSLLGADRFQLSDAALGELDMKFRLKALCRLNILGIRFSSEKQQALLRGDISGTIIDPFFIYSAQCLGMHFCEGMRNSPMIHLKVKYVRRSLELLEVVSKGRDWELRAQKACEAVETAKLQFIPTYGRPPGFSEELHEKLPVLSQIIYFETFLFLTCGGAEPKMTARIEKEFRHRLQEVYPVLFSICPLTMRTQTILLVRDTVTMLNLRPTDEGQFGIWTQSCDELVALLNDYSRTLLFNLRRFQELGDKGGAGVIRSSCVNCLAHLAMLCEVLSKIKPTPQTELDNLCDSTLERLGGLAQDMSMEEYTRLDLLLGVSWKRTLGVFNARLANIPPEHGTKLRRWKETVAGVYSDFEAKLSDDRPVILSLQEVSGDDRTEGSR